MIRVLLATTLTILCWGTYGPLLHWGQEAMGHSRLRPFVCVGLSYFLVAVVAPGIYLYLKGERGGWTVSGALWSLFAGAAGALGSLGIILAFAEGGRPMLVMPLAFGGAPVINAFLTIFLSRSFKQVGPVFLAGLILVVSGAVTVLVFKPGAGPAGAMQLSLDALLLVMLWVAVVAFSWGIYGPVLHRGQMNMGGSRLRPLMCVGLTYFAVAVVVPLVLLSSAGEDGSWTGSGLFWSLTAGVVTSVGALGIIMAFNFGGKPVYVMPLVFGGAPVVNTFFSMATSRDLSPPGAVFYAGLILVAVGAVIVLVFAPRAPHAPPAPSPPNKSRPAAETTA